MNDCIISNIYNVNIINPNMRLFIQYNFFITIDTIIQSFEKVDRTDNKLILILITLN